MRFFKRKKPKELWEEEPKIKELFEKIIERGRLANLEKSNEPKEPEIMATKEEIYKEFNELVKENPYKLSKKSLSQIGGFKILKIEEKKNGMNEIEHEFKWNNRTLKNSSSSSMWKAKDWASVFYGEIYNDYDPQDNDPKIREIIKKAGKKARRNLVFKPRALGFCHVFWKEKKRILKDKYGIDWKTPAERNPDTKYD